MVIENEAQRQRLIDAIITGFKRSFGFKPSLQIVNQILDDFDELPRSQRPNLQDLSGGGFGRESWLVGQYPEFTQEQIDATAPSAGLQATPAPAVREDGRIATGTTDEQGRDVVIDVDPETGVGTEMVDLGNGIMVPRFQPPDEENPLPGFIGGFEEDYIALPPDPSSRIMRIAQAERLRDQDPTVFADLTAPKTPKYREGDHNALFAARGAEYILGVQAQLIAAGFVDEEDMARERGLWGPKSMQAMGQLMAVSNARGVSWQRMARQFASVAAQVEDEGDGGDGDPAGGRVFVAPTYREPDHATLSQAVKGLFREALGRDPLDYEIALFADQLSSEYRNEYEADVSAQRSEFEAGNHAIREGAETGAPASAAGGTVADVDPTARFLERFESQYEGQLTAVEDRAESDAMQTRVSNIISRVTGLMGQ